MNFSVPGTSPDEFLPALLDLSVSGVVCYAPLTDEADTIVDFAFVYLNAAAQHLLSLPAQPTLTYRQVFPEEPPFEAFTFHCAAYGSEQPRHFELNYRAGGYDAYCRVNGRRLGQLLLVSFSFSQEQDRNVVEQALRESRAGEIAARAEAERGRVELMTIFEQAPVAIAIFEGPDHVIRLANPAHLELWGKTAPEILNKPLFQAVPEASGLGYEQLLADVLRTGKPFVAKELSAELTRKGQRAPVYFDFVYQPWRNEQGEVTGVIVVATEITQQVAARHQAETLQAEVLASAQRQLQARETFYQVFEQTPACIALLRGPEHRIEYHNQAYQRVFPGRNMRGRTVAEVQPDTVTQGFSELLDNVFQTGETFVGRELPASLIQPDGSQQLFYFNFTYQAYREDNRIVGISVFAYDVTAQVRERELREAEQVQAQLRLQESEQRLHDIVKDAPFPMGVYVGPELRIQLANEAILAAWGKGPDVIGQRFTDLMPELADQSVFEELHHVLRTGEAVHRRNQRVEIVVNGILQPFYFNYTFTPLPDAQGKVYGILNTATDVTDLILAQQRLEAYAAELRESEARFRIMADVAPNQVWAVHPDGSIRYINRAFLDFVGLQTEEEYLAIGWTPYLHPDELSSTQQTLLHAITQRVPYVLEHRMLRHDGQYRWLLAQGAPSFLADGELYGYVGSAIDITELKQANEQLTRTNQDLDNFVYAASHDLKQPVNNLEGLFDEVLASSTFNNAEEEQVLVPMVQEALQQLRVTIDDLAALGQAQQLRHAAAEKVLLAELMEEVLTVLEPQVRATQARITTDFGAWPAISFARANLRTILLNLVGNSLKYADPARPARVHVSTWVERGQPVLLVEDNGLGFDAARYGAELFHLFRRLHTHTAGTGVGLYLVNRIVEASGGKIEVDSRPGEGATFRIRFGPG
ncbi:PAS domain-containing sensor histidine kinase [Hymenobacter pini]|uniref:PAS domain-containing sensor histidine kinase n=1 Tax=Hymenobacter pini TaxID=2880879 RepID=UPI001CF35250|nr:PAS domain-containing protein [Hymenobacter pini]MCA8832399.1 PAS domain-containing protein [Hymenobacter pini]